MEHWGNDTDREKLNHTDKKPVPVPHHPLQTSGRTTCNYNLSTLYTHPSLYRHNLFYENCLYGETCKGKPALSLI